MQRYRARKCEEYCSRNVLKRIFSRVVREPNDMKRMVFAFSACTKYMAMGILYCGLYIYIVTSPCSVFLEQLFYYCSCISKLAAIFLIHGDCRWCISLHGLTSWYIEMRPIRNFIMCLYPLALHGITKRAYLANHRRAQAINVKVNLVTEFTIRYIYYVVKLMCVFYSLIQSYSKPTGNIGC